MSTSRGGGTWTPGGRKGRLQGSFLNGVWHCDCNPPLPAVHFPVKKEGPNKGRMFRACQKLQNDTSRCKFFLWDSDAAGREAAALANGSRTEPARANITPSRLRIQRAVSPPPPYTPETARSSAGASGKRSRADISDSDDDFGLGGNTAFDEELDQVWTALDTPSKKAKTETLALSTRRRLPWQKDSEPKLNGIPTPQTERHTTHDLLPTSLTRSAEPDGPFQTPLKHKQTLEASQSRTLSPPSSPIVTPTPQRFKDANFATTDDALVRDVFGILQEDNVEFTEETRCKLVAVLTKHATIAEGVKKGRDVARCSIKAKEAKVNELSYRVNTLQAELEEQQAIVKQLQWKAEHAHHED